MSDAQNNIIQLKDRINARGAPSEGPAKLNAFLGFLKTDPVDDLGEVARQLRVVAFRAKDNNLDPLRTNAQLWRIADNLAEIAENVDALQRKLRKAKKRAKRRA
jgi:hypothetical protein